MRTAIQLFCLLAVILPLSGAERPYYWSPAQNTTWQWQLSGTLDRTINVAMYDIDLFGNSSSVVSALHAQGRRVVCYLSAGSWEDSRPDAAAFPDSVKGLVLAGYPNERWLDIRNLAVLGPILSARLDLCKSKGFDAVEPDNVDGFTNKTGFPLTYADQIAFNTWLANAAHARGLSVALKNDTDQIADLVGIFDWSLNEQCFEYKECNTLLPFIRAGKAVFNVEYKLMTSQFCAQANTLNFNSMLKDLDLTAFRQGCRDGSPKAIVVTPSGVVNAASLKANPVAPGEIVSIFGVGLGPSVAGSLTVNANGTVATTLTGVQVLFDGFAAPMFYAGPGQLNVSVPYEIAGQSSTQVQVQSMGIASDPVAMPVTAMAPALFTFDPGGTGQGAILNQDSSVNSASNPAGRGSVVVLFATGEGQTTPEGVNGKLASDVLPKPVASVTVKIGGVSAELLYAGAAPGEVAGVMQLNARVPSGIPAGNAVPVQLIVGNVTGQAGVTLAVQ